MVKAMFWKKINGFIYLYVIFIFYLYFIGWLVYKKQNVTLSRVGVKDPSILMHLPNVHDGI